jgi:hypothetical protein
MATQPKTFQRLPGRASSVAEYYRVYALPDHILSVTASGFSENYRRFYYRDIQAIIVRQTDAGRTANIILGILVGLTALIWLGPILNPDSQNLGFILFCAIANGLFLLPLVINILLGPTCHCYIKTAVQTDRLYAVGRLRTAQKFLDRIRPRIMEAQSVPAATKTSAAAAPTGGSTATSPEAPA